MFSTGFLVRGGLIGLALALTGAVAPWACGWEPLRAQDPRAAPTIRGIIPPPLKLPVGFRDVYLAHSKYPSVISIGPRPGTLFVAADYMTGLGTEIIRRDEVRLIEYDRVSGEGQRATAFAKGFNSIMGLAWHDGTLFVMHAPLLTALRDTDHNGVADERTDLLSGLGLPPHENPVRLHCANGVVVGHDGWLYLALGDHGCSVLRQEGDRLVHEGGGILRCRPDGRDLHVYARGLRNIYDVALDDELNVFVRDNENDGGTYKQRIYQSYFNADHGYPYLYEERPDEALPPLADVGLGSSAGVVCYLEHQFPPEYRKNLLFCEWGRAVVRYSPPRTGGTQAKEEKEVEFAAGNDTDPLPFRPTDLVVDHDGALIVSDWADGQRPNRGRGRVFRISYDGKSSEVIERTTPVWPVSDSPSPGELNDDSYHRRCAVQAALERRGVAALGEVQAALGENRLLRWGRLHAVWILARLAGAEAIEPLLKLAESDAEPGVRIQAVRAVADLSDPVLVQKRLDAGRGDAKLAARLAKIANQAEPRVSREIIVALGRLRWSEFPGWLQKQTLPDDPAWRHAALQTLRRSETWSAIIRLLDEAVDGPLHKLAVHALADCYDPAVAEEILARLNRESGATRRFEYANLLTRVYKKPGPWVYWGYRPPPRPANSVDWEKTEAIAAALNQALLKSDASDRLPLLGRMQREKAPVGAATLTAWLREERRGQSVAAILEALREQPAAAIRDALAAVARSRDHAEENRLRAIAILAEGITSGDSQPLVELCGELEDGPVLAAAVRQAAKHPGTSLDSLVREKLGSTNSLVIAATLDVLAKRPLADLQSRVLELLDSSDLEVRRAAVAAAGAMKNGQAADRLLALAHDDDPQIRRAALESLRQLKEPRVVPLAVEALSNRDLALTAIGCLRESSGPQHAAELATLAQRDPSWEIQDAVLRTLDAWRERAGSSPDQQEVAERSIAEVMGSIGLVARWRVREVASAEEAASIARQVSAEGLTADKSAGAWRVQFGSSVDARLKTPPAASAPQPAAWLAYADVTVPTETAVEFFASSSGGLEVWRQGYLQHRRTQAMPFRVDSDVFSGKLTPGLNRLILLVDAKEGSPEFHFRFRRKTLNAEHARLIQAALERTGSVDRGRQIFLNVEKSQCLKCHRVGDQGERIGPELTGVGSRFAKMYLIESILEPSRAIAPSFDTYSYVLGDGRVLNGVKVAETPTSITVADNQGQKRTIDKTDIEEQHRQNISTMAEGLEKRLTMAEFVDLIAFLMSQKKRD